MSFDITAFANDMLSHMAKSQSLGVSGRELTLCWRCSASYPWRERACPTCGAANANTDLGGACRELAQEASERGTK